jgi:hypothetical protein
MNTSKLIEGYTVLMALQDFMPVIFSSIGLFFLAKMVSRVDKTSGYLAYLGWFMITSGGANKATWKLWMAFSNSQTDIRWLDDSLFLLMAPGFTAMAFAIFYMQRHMVGKKPILGHPFILSAIVNAICVGAAVFMAVSRPESRTWFFILLGLTTFSNVSLAIMVIRQGYKFGSILIALLFAFNILMVFMLTGMARIDDQSIGLQWAQQISNTISNGAFALASYKLYQLMSKQDAPVAQYALKQA